MDKEKLNLGVFGMLKWALRAVKGLSQRCVLVSSCGSPQVVAGCIHEELNVQVY